MKEHHMEASSYTMKNLITSRNIQSRPHQQARVSFPAVCTVYCLSFRYIVVLLHQLHSEIRDTSCTSISHLTIAGILSISNI